MQSWHPAWQALRRLLQDDILYALPRYRGKLGLALSGGGFRASFYHLGVLARLAEMDALRSVEVLSTVSGGSLVAIHYYLELQQLLQNRSDRDISREDGIALVRRVQKDFLQGVQQNIRIRSLTRLSKNLKMLFLPGYSN